MINACGIANAVWPLPMPRKWQTLKLTVAAVNCCMALKFGADDQGGEENLQ